ncbi:MAG: hypothetical protein M1832_002181 [Thelocarpon impressellum]|nr:MAG: hypothetical protein M1832_002181 [Thelocarpon impressellum]
MCNPLKRSSAYDANFDQHLTLNGIYGNFEDPIPANWNDIRQRLARRRPSLSETRFPEKAFKSFARAVHNSTSEQALMGGPLSTVAGKAQFRSSRDMEFGNLRPLTDGTLIEAKPGFFDGADLEELNHRIRSQLGNDVIPSTRPRDPVLPNFFLEGKGPEGRAAGGLLQARYDGALGARGMLTMQGFGAASGPSYDRNAYTITGCFTQFLGMLSLYCIYPTRPKHAGGAPEYHMILLGGWALRANAEQFRAGVAAFRNAREWAKEQRDEVIRAANARVRDVEGEGAGVNPAKPTEGSEPPSSRGRRLRPRPNPQVRAANVLQ